MKERVAGEVAAPGTHLIRAPASALGMVVVVGSVSLIESSFLAVPHPAAVNTNPASTSRQGTAYTRLKGFKSNSRVNSTLAWTSVPE